MWRCLASQVRSPLASVNRVPDGRLAEGFDGGECLMRLLWITAVTPALIALSGCARRPPVAPRTPAPVAAAVPDTAPVPTYVCHRAGGEITVDGHLHETAWDKAEGVRPFPLWNGGPAIHDTEARLLWDNKNLYLAVDCADPDIRATMARRDENLWEENEVVELFADANGDGRCYLEFEINPLNTVLDLILPEAGGGGSLAGKKCWDAKGLRSAVVKESTARVGEWVRWTVELAIPLECFLDAPNCPPEDGDEWRVNLYRVDESHGQVEFQAWSPTNTEKPSFHVPERFGVLRFTEALVGEGATE
jgi:hypothetical protein